jgi:DNA repair protein RadC
MFTQEDYSDLPLFQHHFAKPETTSHFYVRCQMIREKAMPYLEFNTSEDAVKYIRGQIGDYEREVLLALGLNIRNGLQVSSIVHIGTANTSICNVADVLRVALFSCSPGLIVAHNHPSGNPEPSREDKMLTDKLQKASGYMDVKLLDHIIIGNPHYFSFADNGLLYGG